MHKEGDLVFFHHSLKGICVATIIAQLYKPVGLDMQGPVFLLETASENKNEYHYATIENIIRKLSSDEEFALIMEKNEKYS